MPVQDDLNLHILHLFEGTFGLEAAHIILEIILYSNIPAAFSAICIRILACSDGA